MHHFEVDAAVAFTIIGDHAAAVDVVVAAVGDLVVIDVNGMAVVGIVDGSASVTVVVEVAVVGIPAAV